MQDFKRRGMNRVAAKIAKEIPVLLEDNDRHTGTGQKPAQHHAGRTAARDGALDAHELQSTGSISSWQGRERPWLAPSARLRPSSERPCSWNVREPQTEQGPNRSESSFFALVRVPAAICTPG